ncbi:hypothetical protein D3C85_1285800 [compost metagenome]
MAGQRWHRRGQQAHAYFADRHATGGADHVGQHVRLAGQGLDTRQQIAAEVGEGHAAPGTVEQAHAAGHLQLGDVPADHRLRHVEGHGGLGQAAELRDLDEQVPLWVEYGLQTGTPRGTGGGPIVGSETRAATDLANGEKSEQVRVTVPHPVSP